MLVLFGGLMALHHLPGGGHHGQKGGTERSVPPDLETEGEDTPHAEQGGAKVSGSNRRQKGGGGHSDHCH